MMLFDKAMNLLLKYDDGALLAYLAREDWEVEEWLDAKMPDYKGLYCDVLGRGRRRVDQSIKILHGEAQRNNDPKMGKRTLTYGGAVVKYHDEVPIHVIIYFGPEPCTMPRAFEDGQYLIRYALVSARDTDAETIFAVGTISAVIFSFLCNIRQRETYIDKALRRMFELTPTFWGRRKAINLLFILLQLRDKALRDMVRQKIIAMTAEENRKVLEGSIGWELGFDKGQKEGFDKGQKEKDEALRREFILNLKADTGFDDERIARIVGVPIETVRAVLDNNGTH